MIINHISIIIFIDFNIMVLLTEKKALKKVFVTNAKQRKKKFFLKKMKNGQNKMSKKIFFE